MTRLLRDLSVSPTATPIALTSILSQDGRGGKMGMGSRLRGSKRGEAGVTLLREGGSDGG